MLLVGHCDWEMTWGTIPLPTSEEELQEKSVLQPDVARRSDSCVRGLQGQPYSQVVLGPSWESPLTSQHQKSAANTKIWVFHPKLHNLTCEPEVFLTGCLTLKLV